MDFFCGMLYFWSLIFRFGFIEKVTLLSRPKKPAVNSRHLCQKSQVGINFIMSFIRRALDISSTGKTLFRNQWKQYVPGNRYMSKQTQLAKTFRKGRVARWIVQKLKRQF